MCICMSVHLYANIIKHSAGMNCDNYIAKIEQLKDVLM